MRSAQAGFRPLAIERRQWKDALALQPSRTLLHPTRIDIILGSPSPPAIFMTRSPASSACGYDQILDATSKGSKPYNADYLKNNAKSCKPGHSMLPAKRGSSQAAGRTRERQINRQE